MGGYTPGPWHVKADRIWQEGDNPWPIAYLGEGAKREANARLIAAAPELLAALEALVWSAKPSRDRDNARELIAKVKGN